MMVLTVELTLYAPWIHSLKEKRMELRSLLKRLRAKFDVAVAEVGEQDTHQTLVIGIAAIVHSTGMADSVYENVLRFVEAHTEAEVTAVTREIR